MEAKTQASAGGAGCSMGDSPRVHGMSSGWRPGRLVGLALMVLGLGWAGSFGALGTEGTEDFPLNREPAVLYREYLAQIPPIRYISYRRANSRVRQRVAESPGAPETIVPRVPRMFELERFEAAWQPGGCFWWRRLGTAKGRLVFGLDGTFGHERIPEGLEYVEGANHYYYWALAEGHLSLYVMFRANTAGGRENGISEGKPLSPIF